MSIPTIRTMADYVDALEPFARLLEDPKALLTTAERDALMEAYYNAVDVFYAVLANEWAQEALRDLPTVNNLGGNE